MKTIFILNRYLIILGLLTLSITGLAQNYNTIEFVENKGQWDSQVKFKSDVSGGAFFIRKDGVTILQNNREDLYKIYTLLHMPLNRESDSGNEKILLRSHSYNVDFVDASPDMEIVPDKPLPTYINYFIGNDPSKWAANCRVYQGITVKNVYPNVDIRYFTDNGTLKYDIIAKPGANLDQIALRYTGVNKLSVKNKELQVATSIGDLTESSPYTYQTMKEGRREVSCRYEVKNNIVKFRVKDYDPAVPLIIDPSLIFCSFSGSKVDNWGFTATYGPDGSMYGGGIVFGTGFPVSPGAFQTSFQGGGGGGYAIDIGLIKLTPDGTNRVYATYLGGSGNEQPHSLIVDPQGNLILAGRSDSPNYPTAGPIDTTYSGSRNDIIITKLNAAGNGLIGSVKIGGANDDGVNISANRSGSRSLNQNYGDDGRSEVQLDGAGNIYVASCTQSGDFPTVNAFQTTNNGGSNFQDGVVLKLDPNLSSLLFSTYLGGSGNDAAYVVDLAPNGNIYVAGGTESTDFPGVPGSGVINSTNSGGIDGFVTILNNSGSLIRSTYVGTIGIDQVYGIKFDNKGFPYIMGQTTGNWPVVNAPYSNSGSKQFISKLQPDLSGYVYSTIFGSPSPVPNISPVAFLVDRCENVYVSGWGGKSSFTSGFLAGGTSMSMPITPDALKSTTDGKDFYFFVLEKDAAGVLFGSFYGEDNGNAIGADGTDHVDGGTSRFDKNGVIYQAICGNCKEFNPNPPYPTTPGAWATTNPSPGCNLTMLKIAFNLAGVRGGVQSTINGAVRDTAGCVPLTVDFADTVKMAQSYEWYFGDGSPMVTSTAPNITHIYNTTGTFLVMMVAIDPSTCNVRDSSYMHIRVGNVQANLNFNITKLNPCDSFKYQFDNLSTTPPAFPFGAQSFVWDFGDGSSTVIAGINNVTHNYPSPGTYNVKLTLVDTTYCNAPDSLTVQLRVAALVKAQFDTPPLGCAPYTAVFNNTSVAGQTFIWDFGDGSGSNDVNPAHLYSTPGTYTVTLIANDPNTCNLTDTFRYTISVFDKPVSNFTTSPVPPVENTPTTFDNLSSPDAVTFKWLFGDGDTLLTNSRSPAQHQYNSSGTFNACLIAYNAAGCADTSCQQVQAIIFTLVDVPNAFTPQSGDINSKVMVRGFGITKLKFIIWNRWGQKVFETANRLEGWDGKFKGVLQPMDVYAYTLEVEFFDGTKTTKKGDITLIR